MTAVTFSRQNDAGSRVSNTQYLENPRFRSFSSQNQKPHNDALWGGGGERVEFYFALWASVWSKNKKAGGRPLPHPGPSPGSATADLLIARSTAKYPRIVGLWYPVSVLLEQFYFCLSQIFS